MITFLISILGLFVALIITTWMLTKKIKGDDHPLTPEEIKKRVGECFDCEK